MLIGIDVSHHNDTEDIKKISDLGNFDFLIAKASEGKSFKDNKMMKYGAIAYYNDIPFGIYHYARPDLNRNVDSEVANFLEEVHRYFDFYPESNLILALDWEGKSLSYEPEWALSWLDRVTYETGIKPLFYCQQSALKKYTKIAEADYGLWVARYASKVGDISPWPFYAFWQFTSSQGKLDCDKFNGTMENLLKYSGKDMRIIEEESRCPKECNCDCCKKCPLLNGK